MASSVHLGYCSNIHPGEAWNLHFANLQESIPTVKARLSPDAPMGLGLRLAHEASLTLTDPQTLATFQEWLRDNDVYVFTMNGFPYGGFHDVRVKDQVHAPDWTTQERVDYTIRLARILVQLLPEALTEGGISTSPLSYRLWYATPNDRTAATETATENILRVVRELIRLREQTGKLIHLDIEPEPDGILENGAEFITWYETTLLPTGILFLQKEAGLSAEEAAQRIREHVQLCYDVCHFAVAYEEPEPILARLAERGIRVGKLQISSALKADLTDQAAEKLEALASFNEPTYLHQVVARTTAGTLDRYPDLPEALRAYSPPKHQEWRIHFHVPLFLPRYGLLESTQAAIIKVLRIQQQTPFTQHLEVETYTWGVLPEAMQLPLNESISREMTWVQDVLRNGFA